MQKNIYGTLRYDGSKKKESNAVLLFNCLTVTNWLTIKTLKENKQ